MKRWNGWGNVDTDYPLPDSARQFLQDIFGFLDPKPDADFERVLASVPDSRLTERPHLDLTPEARLVHARGQSLPDWVALRSGRIPYFPDGVAYPANEEEVRTFLKYAQQIQAKVIPYGGGTSVVGHINVLQPDVPVLTLSLEKMTRLLELDAFGRTAVFEAGVVGPELERNLGRAGLTLGHYPQSHEFSTLGGWIAARSSGQQAYYYGRIEQLFAGGHVETPCGPLDLPHYPASAAGPDIKELILGSEGRMGVITQARVRVSKVPDAEEFHGVFFPTWEQGVDVVRQIAQERVSVSMLRLSNPKETETTLILAGKSWTKLAIDGLSHIGYGPSKSLLVFGITGSRSHIARVRRQVSAYCRKKGGLFVGRVVGHSWEKARFYSPYLRNTLWDAGVTIDTLETAIPWSKVLEASRAIPEIIMTTMEKFNEKILAFVHLSHIYRDAASIYTTFLFRRIDDPDQLLEHWHHIKNAASLTIQELGGTITHQHGVGTDHARYLPAEKGRLGMQVIQAACKSFDPEGMMNPGKLIEEKEQY